VPLIQDVLCIGGLGIILYYISYMLLVSLSEIAVGLSDVCHFACVTCKFVYIPFLVRVYCWTLFDLRVFERCYYS